jgi:hypothetical protein
MSTTSSLSSSSSPPDGELHVIIEPGGYSHFIYDERLAPLFSGCDLNIWRASRVEPSGGKWYAHMNGSPVVLGPFDLRSQALSAERAWLEENLLNRKGPICPPQP